MKTSYKPRVLDAEPDETTLIVAEIDNLIASCRGAHGDCKRDCLFRDAGFEGSASMRVSDRIELCAGDHVLA